MSLHFRFAVISDPHIALPHTIWDHPSRFHLVEVSIPALETVLSELETLDLDFLLLPGDLTQHGESENHAWMVDRLSRLPYPAYVVPGNHDIPAKWAVEPAIGLADFPLVYQKFGYSDATLPYYTCEVLPGVQLIGLNSNQFDAEGKQLSVGQLDAAQINWLRAVLADLKAEVVLVMVHHNVIEHLPNQSANPMGRRYMLENAAELLDLLAQAGVKLLFTGHLHVQDIASQQGIYEITTGSLVSFPHPYRVFEFQQDQQGQRLQVESGRVTQLSNWPNLQQLSREWMGDRSFSFMLRLLTLPPLSLTHAEAEKLAPDLRYFWADIANGDAVFDFPHFPHSINQYFAQFGSLNAEGKFNPIDNFALLQL